MVTVLQEAEWTARQRAHIRRAEAMLAGHRERRRRGLRHPVADFLFTYYSYSPAKLTRWHPGAGTALAGPGAEERRHWRHYAAWQARGDAVVGVDAARFRADRAATVDFVQRLLTATRARPAHLGCLGLHEWAMVYRQPAEERRHAQVPLRLGAAGTDRVVEDMRIHCSHFDAFRFFTADARERNRIQPTRERQVSLEQPGCLHANMDLYKWAYKLAPATPSELVLDCFALACALRELDMRASPYDLSSAGYSPIRIETAEGRADYVTAQRELAERAAPLRDRLLAVCAAVQEERPDDETEVGR